LRWTEKEVTGMKTKRLPVAAATVVYAAAMVYLHWNQLVSSGRFASDLVNHLGFAMEGMVYSTTSLLLRPAYALGGMLGVALLVTAFQLAILAAFAAILRLLVPEWPLWARWGTALVCGLAQAVWIPRGGYWYNGTVTGNIFHNTTYIMMAPFALLTMLLFCRLWPGMRNKLDLRLWGAYTALLTVTTSFKANFVFAFAPALLLWLIADCFATRGRNLKNEIVMGCSVFPSVALCLIQAGILFTEPGSGMTLIFEYPFSVLKTLPWGPFNEAGILGLLRSLVFPAVMLACFGHSVLKEFSARFSLVLFAVALAEGIFLVEAGDRFYHANLWWGSFIAMLILQAQLVGVLIREARRRAHTVRLALCGAALLWHIVSGACFLVQLLQGKSFDIPILTYHIGW